jgi:histidyl-tRNA synthetase
MGKYGEEGDKLIFKILNNGLNDPKHIDKAKAAFEKVLEGKNSADLTERALKYDLTIPFARFVAMNHQKLTLPYRRYQIQPVWRADRPQKGRYREFTQCDADVVGSQSLINEVELTTIYHTVFTQLGLTEYELRINSRKILAALAEVCGGTEKIIDITIAIDKLDKIGIEKVKEELQSKGLTENQILTIEKYLSISGTNAEKLQQIESLIGKTEIGKKGIEEVAFVFQQCPDVQLVIDFTLARGLNYYTGVIFEAKAPASVKMGSIGGGGRYDDLTGLFGVSGIPGVGISFGVDRIYDVMEELQLFPATANQGTQVLFFNLGETESAFAFQCMQQLRAQQISCELYHENAKMGKQFNYAEKKNIPFVIIIGQQEITENACVIKNLATQEQQKLTAKQLIQYFNK